MCCPGVWVCETEGSGNKTCIATLQLLLSFPLSFLSFCLRLGLSSFLVLDTLPMSDTLQPKHRSSSYQRLKAKLKRNPSSYTAVDKKDWPRPQNVTDLLIHAIKGGGSYVYRSIQSIQSTAAHVQLTCLL